jgi:hypothetical protein
MQEPDRSDILSPQSAGLDDSLDSDIESSKREDSQQSQLFDEEECLAELDLDNRITTLNDRHDFLRVSSEGVVDACGSQDANNLQEKLWAAEKLTVELSAQLAEERNTHRLNAREYASSTEHMQATITGLRVQLEKGASSSEMRSPGALLQVQEVFLIIK